MANPDYRPVYALSRGGHLESLHYGAIAVVNANGELVASYGDAQASSFLRSTAKPFQVLPFVLAGGVEHYGLTQQELALICASHSGTDEHVQVFESIRKKCGIEPEQLLCGVHPPFHKATADRLQAAGAPFTVARHNCSGKHLGMLAYAKMRGWDTANYIDPAHPMQQEIFALFAELAGLSVSALAIGIDGCSAPNWAAPLYNVALAYARLMDPSGLPAAQAAACTQVRDAMTTYPFEVAGPERFDTDLMTAAKGRILSKGGAEGFEGIGLSAGALGAGSPALGVALKISDGDARAQACQSVALETLRQLGAVTDGELRALSAHGPQRAVTNWRGIEVGRAEPVFDLQNQ
jgi:L-asparaginase II